MSTGVGFAVGDTTIVTPARSRTSANRCRSVAVGPDDQVTDRIGKESSGRRRAHTHCMTNDTTRAANTEGRAVLEAIFAVREDAPTACAAWSAHDLVAHLAAGAKEVADLVTDKLDGRPDRPTRGFDEREAPFRLLPHDELVQRLIEENKRKLHAYDEFAANADPSIAFTGTRVNADRLATHSRSEAAIHRWDLVGDDDTSRTLLGQPDLAAHAAWVLDAMPVLNESGPSIASRAAALGHPRATLTFRSEGAADIVLTLDAPTARFDVVDHAEDSDVVMTMAADHRLLVLWGRRPSTLTLDTDGNTDLLAALDEILWPNALSWP